MRNEFIPYQQALDLKELGFDEPCIAFYKDNRLSGCKYPDEDSQFDLCTNTQMKEYKNSDKYYSAPLYQQAFSWFIVNHNLYGDILPWSVKKLVDDKLVEKIVWYYSVEKLGKPSRYKPYEFTGDTPEEAKLECLKKLIEVIKEKS